jgi:hypothetical protein
MHNWGKLCSNFSQLGVSKKIYTFLDRFYINNHYYEAKNAVIFKENTRFIYLFWADKTTDLSTAYLCSLIFYISVHDDIV